MMSRQHPKSFTSLSTLSSSTMTTTTSACRMLPSVHRQWALSRMSEMLLLVLLVAQCHGFSTTQFVDQTRAATPWFPNGLLHSGAIVTRRHQTNLPRMSCKRSTRQSTKLQQATSSSLTTSTRPQVPAFLTTGLSALGLVALHVLFRTLFDVGGLTFPSSLAGCGVLLVTLLLLTRRSRQPEAAPTLYRALQPGAALLAKWLPIFFVPSLITLPLSARLSSAAELFKVSVVVLGGFLWTLLTTALSVVMVKKIASSVSSPKDQTVLEEESSESETVSAITTAEDDNSGSINNDNDADAAAKTTTKAVTTSNNNKPNGPFSNTLFYTLAAASASTGVGATVTHLLGMSQYATPCTTLFFLVTTLASFVYGTRLPKAFTKWCHPLLTCTALTWTTLSAFGLLTGRSFVQLLRLYRTGKMSGAGDLLLFCLGPAVVSLALSMYERRQLMRDNLPQVVTAIAVSTLGGVFGTAWAVRWLEIGDPTVRLALLSRNITSPLAMAMAGILGADVSLAVTLVVVTGLVGANFGASLLSMCGIADPVARGLGMGAAAHGLGTAALVDEPDAFPFSAIAMALTASAATVTVSIPLFRRLILEVALGW